MTTITGSVGILNGTKQVENAVADQTKVIGLLLQIEPKDGGNKGQWAPPPVPGSARNCPQKLADAIRDFQEVWRKRGKVKKVDGVLDRDGWSFRKIDDLASDSLIGPNGIDTSSIRFRQMNPENLTKVHDVTQNVISPLSIGNDFQEIAQKGSIREFLFEMRKDNHVYWIGVAVPQGTSNFSKTQVFFHPTVVNGGNVHAADGDYKTFRGGWAKSIQRYVSMQGGQLAGARQTTLLVPFMTMAAQSGSDRDYMFATRPTETLNAIMTAVRNACIQGAESPVQVSQVGVSSFSSGIGAMRLFIKTFGSTGVIKETTDFDSPYIVAEPKLITRASGAVGRVFTQMALHSPQFGWLTLAPNRLRKISKYKDKGAHAQIGWMTYFLASLSSVII